MGRRKVKKEVKRVYFDYSLLFITIFLAAFGIVMIYSTSSYTAQMNYGSSEYYFYKQLTYTLIGFAGMYITYKFDYHFWQRIWKWVMAFGVIIMFALIPFGSVVNGAKRWIRFLGIGVQPADKYVGLTPEKIIKKINERYKNSIVTTDVGQNQLWTTQYLELDENRQLLTSGVRFDCSF